jgi:hyperosmotically inducible periplasmic protein
MVMKASSQKSLLLASSLAMLLGLAACDRVGDQMTGTRSSDSGKYGSAASNAKRDAKDATASAGAAADRAAENTKSMGATAANKVDDASITAKVNAALAADKDLSAAKIDVDTQNGVVTLSGPAPSASAKEHASTVARGIKGVTSVNNQLTVKAS